LRLARECGVELPDVDSDGMFYTNTARRAQFK